MRWARFALPTLRESDGREGDRQATRGDSNMSKPVIVTIAAVWHAEAAVWSGHGDEIPAAADAPTLDAPMAETVAVPLDA